MKIEDQVCSLELAKRLKELSVKQLSMFLYNEEGFVVYRVWPKEKTREGEFAAFTVAELGEMLPAATESYRTACGWVVNFSPQIGHKVFENLQNEADGRAKMLIYLIENKLVTP